VGIGTNSPNVPLHILTNTGDGFRVENTNASSWTTIRMTAPSRTYQFGTGGSSAVAYANKFYVYDETAGAARFVIDTNGNFGIGGADATIGSKLGIYGNATIGTTYYSTAAPANGLLVEGNVGLGLINPSQKLSIAGNMSLTGAIYDSLTSAGTDGMILQTTGSATKWVSTSSLGLTSPPTQWTTAGSDIYYSGGKVGIGTSSPNVPLHIVTNTGDGFRVENTNASSWTTIRMTAPSRTYQFGTGGSSAASYVNKFYVYDETAGATRFVIDTNGNFGIAGGDSAIGSKFGVNGNATIGTSYYSTAAPANGLLVEGNIGLGLTNPSEKLDVTGNIRVNDSSAYMLGDVKIAYGSKTLGNYFFGGAGNQTMTGLYNTGNGYQALSANTIGYYNTANGYMALASSTANYNTAYGYKSLTSITLGEGNTAVGFNSMPLNGVGSNNTVIGADALFSNTAGSQNVVIGAYAGHYEMGSNTFYVDNQDRTDTAGDKVGALFYGKFNSVASDQELTINASTSIAQNMSVFGTGNSYFAGKVGIGTTTPSAKFAVYSVSTTPLAYFADDASNTLQLNSFSLGLILEGYSPAFSGISGVGFKDGISVVNGPANSIYEALGSPNTIGMSFASADFATSSDITFEDQTETLKLRSDNIELDATNGGQSN
jgi:hypothetical protein